MKLPIEKCSDKQAYLELSMTADILEADTSDTASNLSGLDGMSVGSDPESEFDFAEFHGRAGIKKKNTLLTDAP